MILSLIETTQMPDLKAFIDTNVLIYLLSTDTNKADRAEQLIQKGGAISVQVLNEITNVARRRLNMNWTEINELLTLIRAACAVEPLTLDTHDKGRYIAERYQLSVYDSMIVAAALLADCKTLYSEGMQDGILIENQLRISNPFTVNID